MLCCDKRFFVVDEIWENKHSESCWSNTSSPQATQISKSHNSCKHIWKTRPKATYCAPEFKVPHFLTDRSGQLSLFFDWPKNTPEWQHAKECMCRLQNIATCICDYNVPRKCDSQTDTRTDRHKNCKQTWVLASIHQIPSAVPQEKSVMSRPVRDQDGHLGFPISPKNTNLVKDVEILVPVKFCRIPFYSYRKEVKKVSANQRPGQPSLFSNQPEKHKGSVTIVADFSPEFNLQFRWRSEHQPKNHRAYQ